MNVCVCTGVYSICVHMCAFVCVCVRVHVCVRDDTPAPPAPDVLELPVHTKYLLIAAYLASYNPATTDKRFFAKVCCHFLLLMTLYFCCY